MTTFLFYYIKSYFNVLYTFPFSDSSADIKSISSNIYNIYIKANIEKKNSVFNVKINCSSVK